MAALLGEGGPDLVRSVLAGGSVGAVRIVQVRYVPRRNITVQFVVTVAGAEVMVTAVSGLDVPDDLPSVEAAGHRIAFWRFPHDPFLPGLASAVDADRVRGLLETLGAAGRDVRVRTRTYRAGRRAVVEVTTEEARVFLKVVRPHRTRALHDHHVALADEVPIPHSLGLAADLGIVALEAMPGRTLRDVVEAGRARPSGRALVDLLNRLPLSPTSGKVAGPDDRVADHARLLEAVLPRQAGRIADLARRAGPLGDDSASVAAHGDFHLGQVLVDEGDIVGLVDVDTAGAGRRVNDLAQMLGHAATVATISAAPAAVRSYGADLVRDFDAVVDGAALRRKTAAAIFGLATGPFRVQEEDWPARTSERLALVEAWLDSVDTMSTPIV
ncbi:MAG TPA: aminoglycoside phosphotransferase family protein [Acidimicrobiia bacterium]